MVLSICQASFFIGWGLFLFGVLGSIYFDRDGAVWVAWKHMRFGVDSKIEIPLVLGEGSRVLL